ncbi:DNA replication factor C, large subunit [Atractiella rhizophila]|nr:DNA replication factor C, large subunit [Atractiella rhizophila]
MPTTSKAANTKPNGGKDIRSFFPTNSQPSSSKPPEKSSKSNKGNPITIDIDSDDAAPAKATPKRKAPPSSEEDEQVKKKPRKSVGSAKKTTAVSDDEDRSVKKQRKQPASSKKKTVVVSDDDDEEEPVKKKIRKSGDVAKKRSAAAISDSDDDAPKKKSKGKGKNLDDFVVDDDESEEEKERPKTKRVASPKKRPAPKKKVVPDSEEEPVKKKAPVKKHKVDTASEDDDAPPTKNARASTSAKAPKEDGSAKPKPKWIPQARAGPSNPGSKDIPEGQDGCLSGLTFVFTGEGESLSREEAIELAKRYGGRITGAPSSKTSYVVLGSDAGPKKLELIAKHKIPTIDEDGLLDLIRTRTAKDVDPKYKQKQKEEQEKMMRQVAEFEKQEKAALKAAGSQAKSSQNGAPALISDQLWADKYAPHSKKDICGNKGQVDKLERWLTDWPKSLKSSFKKPGKDGMGAFRAVLVSGPPGIGKTTAAHVISKELGYEIIEMNASDTRSKKLLETAIRGNIDGRTLGDWVKKNNNVPSASAGSSSTPIDVFSIKDTKTVMIMDEVDGMSAGDRGGVGALNALIKKTKIPLILIANEANTPKMKPLQSTTYPLKFSRPTVEMVRSRMMSILFKEGMKPKKEAVDFIISSSNSDIRQILGMLSMFRRTNIEMDFDESKALSKMNEKNTIQTPWTLMSTLFSPYTYSQTSKHTLTDKLELYFQDFSAMPLFVQDNYLKYKFQLAANKTGKEAEAKKIELASKAADAISDGDLVDRMIHGGDQHWSLLPTHGVFSTVRPASYCHGPGQSGGGYGMGFPAWFGKNSTQGKLQRLLGEIQIRMRLKTSGDRREIRQSYIPALFEKVVTPLTEKGSDSIDEVIQAMDDYYLSKDEWDALVELGIGDNEGEPMLKKIPSATKAAFTRQFNKETHPIPFFKATDLGKPTKKLAADNVPDLEDVVEVDEEVPDEDAPAPNADEDGEVPLGKNKLVKEKKPKGAAAKKATSTKTKK